MPLAIEIGAYGPPSVLECVERPTRELADDEVEVRPVAIGVNRADCFIRSGEWQQGGGFPYVPGLETCGVVARVGGAVRRFAPGDRVITMMQRLGGIHGVRRGGYQELVAVSESVLASVPAELELDVAAELGLPAVTAWSALTVLGVERGARVLVQGGASAVGTMALQMLRALGAHAIATGTRPQKFDSMRAAGAARVISTRQADWPDQAGPVDYVFDLVGRATFRESVDLLRPGGKLVFVGGTSGGELDFSGWALMRPVTLTGYSSESLDQVALARAVAAIARLVAQRALAPLSVTRYPFADAARAHADIEAGNVAGRVVLMPPGASGRPHSHV